MTITINDNITIEVEDNAKITINKKDVEEQHPWWWYQGMNEEPGKIKWNGDR